MTKIKPIEILRRITGISLPVGGISWTLPPPDADFAKKIIAYLEDKRSLYAPIHHEEIAYVTEAVLEIREKLTDFIGELSDDSELQSALRHMRDACRTFLDETQEIRIHAVWGNLRNGIWGKDEIEFSVELGKLRTALGFHIAQIAVRYNIPVEKQLMDIFPKPPRQP